jgi:hypothetical protein
LGYRAAAPASATAWSCAPEPPLTPIAYGGRLLVGSSFPLFSEILFKPGCGVFSGVFQEKWVFGDGFSW